jgi:hypothetical protein
MKKIVGLEEKLQKLSDADKGDMLTYKEMFRNGVALSVTKAGPEAIELFSVALKLKSSGNEIDLEDAEFKLLHQKISENPGFLNNAPWPAWVHGQLLVRLEQSEKK